MYPAPGNRNASAGKPVNGGYFGYSWSAATSGFVGLDLGFYAQGLKTDRSDYRAQGLQLRCLSE
ncbi:hypothetical protein [uncultured Rikenella sp.]|uniref:hypothetical protein n=1 Tax=uncultured Rikenella sp. TaxID=368003 RepID=UPI00272C1A63|nr:hypothetical protein [uncultured Rikenella sp.]